VVGCRGHDLAFGHGHDQGTSPKQFHEADGVGDWRVLGEGARAYFRTGSFAAGARLVQAIGELDGLDEDLVAGGRLVTDEHAPMWWVLADPEGNEVDVATWMSRD
jgi:hypothetical protein